MALWYRVISTHIYSKIISLQNKYTYTARQYRGKVSKILLTFCQYLRVPAIMNLIFCIVKWENFMRSCREKFYHQALGNRIRFNFLIILFDKMSFSKSLRSSGTESEIERMTDFEKFSLQPYTLQPAKSKVPVAYDSNYVSDLVSSNDVATNGVNGRIGSKT